MVTREPSETTEKVLTLDNQKVPSSICSKKEDPLSNIVDNRLLLVFNWTFSVPSNRPLVITAQSRFLMLGLIGLLGSFGF